MQTIRKDKTFTLFNKIYKRYELVNTIISFNYSNKIRKEIVSIIKKKSLKDSLLDVGGGIGIMSSLLSDIFKTKIVCDLSINMMKLGSKKYHSDNIIFLEGDACHLPIKDNSVDVVISTFVARNVDLKKMLIENYRVLKQSGCILLCDFVLPTQEKSLFKSLYLCYMSWIVPIIAFLISFNYKEYRYLANSIRNWMTMNQLKNRIISYFPKNTIKITQTKTMAKNTVAIYVIEKL